MNMIINERTVRAHLDEVRKDLAQNEAEHEVLLNLLKGFEGWLRLYGTKSIETDQLTLLNVNAERINNPMGFGKAVAKVLKDAHGEALHSEEIWRRIKATGFVSKAKDPAGWVDWAASKAGAEKTAPRTWRLKNGNGV